MSNNTDISPDGFVGIERRRNKIENIPIWNSK